MSRVDERRIEILDPNGTVIETVLIAAKSPDSNYSIDDAGRIFKRTNSGWSLDYVFKENTNDTSYVSVFNYDGSVLAIVDRLGSVGYGGAICIFKRDLEKGWVLTDRYNEKRIKLSTSRNGLSMCGLGKTLVVGAPDNNLGGVFKIFDISNGLLELKLQITGCDLDNYGHVGSAVSISMDGTRIVFNSVLYTKIEDSIGNRIYKVFILTMVRNKWKVVDSIIVNPFEPKTVIQGKYIGSVVLNELGTEIYITCVDSSNKVYVMTYEYDTKYCSWHRTSLNSIGRFKCNEFSDIKTRLHDYGVTLGINSIVDGVTHYHCFYKYDNLWNNGVNITKIGDKMNAAIDRRKR